MLVVGGKRNGNASLARRLGSAVFATCREGSEVRWQVGRRSGCSSIAINRRLADSTRMQRMLRRWCWRVGGHPSHGEFLLVCGGADILLVHELLVKKLVLMKSADTRQVWLVGRMLVSRRRSAKLTHQVERLLLLLLLLSL